MTPVAQARRRSRDPILAALVVEIAVYAGTLIACGLLTTTGGVGVVNLLAPLVLTVVNGCANYLMVRADRNLLLTPLFAIRLIAMTMLGLGGLFHLLAPPSIRDQMDYVYATGPADSAKVYLVWLTGMVFLLMGIASAIRLIGRTSAPAVADSPYANWQWRPAALAFFVGFACDSGLTLMQSLGAPVALPSSVQLIFTALLLTGLFFLGEQSSRSPAARAVGGIALVLSLGVGLITMNKSVVLAPALILLLGYLYDRFSLRRLIASVALITTLYLMISPIVFYSRSRDYQAHSLSGSGSLEERIAYVTDYVRGDRVAHTGSETPTAYSISRLDYVMPAGFVIGQYDRGVPSDEIATSGYMLVPRIIWPGKPITTTAGVEVNYLLGLQSTNQIAVTIFADIYWNLGWAGLSVLLAGGFFLGIGTVVSSRILSNGEWVMMPFVFATFRAALGLDGNFATGFMIPVIISIALYWAMRVARVVLPARLGGAD